MEAGIPIATAMDVLRGQTENPTLKAALDEVYDNIQKGMSLSDSLKQQSVFPDILINMVEAGEVSGQLDLVFKRLAENFEKEFKLNQKLKSAFTYPIILCVVAIFVIAILMLKVVPVFAGTIKEMGGEIPIFTKILMAVSDYFVHYWWLNLIVIITIVVGCRMYFKTPSGKLFFGKMAITLPVVKGVVKTIITARFTRTLGVLIGSGVMLIQSLEIVTKIIGNIVVSEKMSTVIDEIKKGRGLTQPLADMDYFPPMLISMVRIGEESGNIDFALDKAADFYDEEVEIAMQNLTTIIEPVITIAMGAVVAFIILSIIYPMFGMYTAISNQ